MDLVDYWPLFGLRIATPRLELRLPHDDELAELAGVAAQGVHDPALMPFFVPWTDAPSPDLERRALQYWWRCRAEFTADTWELALGVFVDGRPIGAQGLGATEFPIRRTAETGSWLGLDHQGQGIGKEMRAAIVWFAFECLGAERVTSGAFHDNPASLAVSLATGYVANGDEVLVHRGEPALNHRLVLTRERWLANRAVPVTITGFEPCRELFGVQPAPFET